MSLQKWQTCIKTSSGSSGCKRSGGEPAAQLISELSKPVGSMVSVSGFRSYLIKNDVYFPVRVAKELEAGGAGFCSSLSLTENLGSKVTSDKSGFKISRCR